jgi:DNA-directed RNA polymerase specialized sigma24 family protein
MAPHDAAARSKQPFSIPSSYDELIRDYGDLVKWCVARVCKEQRLFDDTLNECYVKIIRMDLLGRYTTDVPDYDGMIFKGYLRRSCINAAKTYIGRELHRRESETLVVDGEFFDYAPPKAHSRPNTEEEALADALMEPRNLGSQIWAEFERLVWRRQNELAPRLMEVLRLSLLGHQDTEIAKQYEISHARVWQYRKKLQALLVEYTATRSPIKVA